MNLTLDLSSIPTSPLQKINKVIVLEAESGESRRNCLQQSLNQAEDRGATTWLLNCNHNEDGPWAGLKDLLTAILPQVQAQAADLIIKHDYELTRVLPALRRTISVRYPSLTDIATQKEQIRNYPADRAFRIIHGIIDFLTAWFERSQSSRWVIACDRYDFSGGLVRIFFAELMRRRGQQLNLTLLVAIAPEANHKDVIGKFSNQYLQHIRLDLLPSPTTNISPQEMARLAEELEQQLEDDLIEQEIHLPRLIWYLLLSNQPKLALKYQIKAAAIYNRKGFYEDGLAFAQAALVQLERYCPEDMQKRWLIDSMLYTSYVALDKPLKAFEIMERAIQGTNNPDNLFQGCFMMAMLYIRELQERDIVKAEAYLERGLAELASSNIPEDVKLFQKTFNRNGMALVRYRQGRHQEAVELCQWCYEQVNALLNPEQHLLYRSVLLFNIAQVYDFIGNYGEAINYFTEAMAIDPNYSEYYNSRGNLYFKIGRLNDALEDYLKAIELSAPYPEVWANVGQCYRRLGKMPQALYAYSTALDLQPNQFSVLVARAQVFDMLEQPQAALADYNAALALDDNQPLVLANRAILHYEAGRYQEALNDLNQAIALDPENSDLYQNRAVALTALQRFQEVVGDLKTYLTLAPFAEDRLEVESQLLVLQTSK
ncbi:MAG: tetratricopeptide repeat protein [Nostoc sp.]